MVTVSVMPLLLVVKNERSFYCHIMPRVSAAHLAARRQQILDAARTCFIRNGFHATSMQDVINEAGLSVGAVYRYFPSKNDLVNGIAEQLAAQIREQISQTVTRQHLPLVEAMEEAFGVIDSNVGPDGMLRLAIQVWAESLRDPALAELVKRVYEQIIGGYVLIAEHARRCDEIPEDADVDATGAALAALTIGYGVIRVLLGHPDLESYRCGVRALLKHG